MAALPLLLNSRTLAASPVSAPLAHLARRRVSALRPPVRSMAAAAAAPSNAFQKIQIHRDDTTFDAYVVGKENAPGVVVVQEWWGVDFEIKNHALRIAQMDYRALIPDLYRGKFGLDAAEAQHLMEDLDWQGAVKDIRASVNWLKAHGSSNVGVTGFCMGGALSIASAVLVPEVDAVVAFYGVPSSELADPSQAKAPVQAHFGELDNYVGFSDISVHRGKLSEADARRYFQQLIDGVDYCHSKGVYHPDLKPENLLLDSQGNLKISDFGLSAVPAEGVSLLHTTCGTPNYVAPERIRIEEIRCHEWFRRNYVPVGQVENEDVNLDDVYAVFDDPEEASDQSRNEESGPLVLNAFDLIILSQGLNLSALFDRRQDYVRQQTRFLSCKPAKVVLSTMEVVAQSMGLKTHIRNYKMRVEGLSANKTAHVSVMLEIFEVSPSFFMVEIQRAAGDAVEYLKFNKNFCSKLDEIIWRPPAERGKSRITRMSKR